MRGRTQTSRVQLLSGPAAGGFGVFGLWVFVLFATIDLPVAIASPKRICERVAAGVTVTADFHGVS